ncbi:hypothetical protein YQE_11489, partial [Dendroctonus ponderosae]
MDTLLWICSPQLYHYERIDLSAENCRHLRPVNLPKRPLKALKLDCVFVHYFVKAMDESSVYRRGVLDTVQRWRAPDVLILSPTDKDLIDYNWNARVYRMVRERCEVDHAFSWLSTLGGAFSALGDYFENCAETAGRISMQQLMLAARIGDPNVQARCRLYFSLSLIQKKRFQLASRIIRQEYHLAQRQAAIDERLVRMCKGIWAKLQYEHGTHKRNTSRLK